MDENGPVCFRPESSVPGSAPAEGCGERSLSSSPGGPSAIVVQFKSLVCLYWSAQSRGRIEG